MPPATQLEDRLQNGVILCKMGMKLLPLDSMWKKVYDLEETRYKVCVCVCVYVWVCGWVSVCVGVGCACMQRDSLDYLSETQ